MATGSDVSKHGMWSSRWLFILAAAGSAVGLGNIWKFPYIAGANGGGAFVLLYLGCVALVGIPIMMAEVLLGRSARQSPINAMRKHVTESNASAFWVLIGWMGALAGFMILSYYAVIAGWALHYMVLTGMGTFTGADASTTGTTFNEFLANPWLMLFWHTLFMVFTIFIVARGVSGGIETAIRWFMPILAVLLLVLLGYGVQSGGFMDGVRFMFSFNTDALSVDGFLVALGQAFFTLSLGMGAIMAYGAYVPRQAGIASTVITIALIDTGVALASGMAIFPIVFANGLQPGEGPGLMFVTVPLAFGQMPLGWLFGMLFFLLVSFAAITSAISLTEPALTWLVEDYNAKRWRVSISIGVICWLLGLGTVFSFNYLADFHVVGDFTIFDFVDYVSQNIMLPLGGVLIAVFTAWILRREVVNTELGLNGGVVTLLWSVLCGLVAPIGVLAVMVFTLYQTFFGA
jgi:NSS family neurotransmitter:Na+ symporter